MNLEFCISLKVLILILLFFCLLCLYYHYWNINMKIRKSTKINLNYKEEIKNNEY